MSRIELLANLTHNGHQYTRGHVLDSDEFSEGQLNELIADGVVTRKEDSQPAPSEPDGFPQMPPAPTEPVAPPQPPVNPPTLPTEPTPPAAPSEPVQPTAEQIAQDMASQDNPPMHIS